LSAVRGEVLLLEEPLSLWGGVDVATGVIIEEGHPQYGECLKGRIVVMPHGRGSSSSSSVLAELLRTGLGPAAIVSRLPESILAIGALVADYLYGSLCPVVVSAQPIDRPGIWELDGGTLRWIAPEIAAPDNVSTS
jgi:predicted aconitase with swiveling domain